MRSKVTINDVAQIAGVSKTTVSFYLNGKYAKMSDDTKKRIEETIEKTGFQPSAVARSLNNKSTHLLGVIIGDITNSFANQIVRGIEDYARLNKYQLIVGSSDYKLENEIQYVKSMVAMGVDGFIIQPTVNFEEGWQKLNYKDKPIVYFDSPNRNTKGFWVKTNNYEAVYEACDLLIEKGYKKFVLVTADPEVLTTRLERYRGFVDNMNLKQINYDVLVADMNTSIEEIESKIVPLLETEENVCVFVCNNWLLTKVYQALKDVRHLMPEKLGLIGFDSLEWTELASPSITTIIQPAYEEGKTAASILIDALEERNNEPPNQILKCNINELESTNLK